MHFDVDVFDQEEMPAVTYPLPDGLTVGSTGGSVGPAW